MNLNFFKINCFLLEYEQIDKGIQIYIEYNICCGYKQFAADTNRV